MAIYKTRLKMKNETGTLVLDITMSGKRHYPATFTKLSVPVVVEPIISYREYDPEFFLDFTTALLESYDKKPKQRQLLEDFEYAAHDEIQDNISGNPTLKRTVAFGFESNSGLEVNCINASSRGYGNLKREPSRRGPIIRKVLRGD